MMNALDYIIIMEFYSSKYTTKVVKLVEIQLERSCAISISNQTYPKCTLHCCCFSISLYTSALPKILHSWPPYVLVPHLGIQITTSSKYEKKKKNQRYHSCLCIGFFILIIIICTIHYTNLNLCLGVSRY